MDIDALEALLARLERAGELPRVKLIYTVDYFQNPTGLTLAGRGAAAGRDREAYSKSHRILILEDAAYRELRFRATDVPSIKSFDGRTSTSSYTRTFSKPLARD